MKGVQWKSLFHWLLGGEKVTEFRFNEDFAKIGSQGRQLLVKKKRMVI